MPPFPLISPNAMGRTYPGTGGTRGTSSTLVSRRTLRRKRGWMVTAPRPALRDAQALARAQGSLRDCGDPKGATSSSTASYGGAECWGPKNNTYGWSGKTLQTGEATVALQPSLSSLSCLTLVTARPLGTLEGEKGPCQAAGGRPPPNAPQDPVHHTRDAPAGPAPLTGMPRAPAGPEGPIGPCAPWGEKRKESKGSMGCWGGALRCRGCPNQPCYLQAALLAAPGIGSCRRRTASLNTLSWSVCTE